MEKLYTTEVLYRGGLEESLSFRIESIIYIDLFMKEFLV